VSGCIERNVVHEVSPLVSICIPIFNGEKYLEAALRSALNQTYRNVEIIVSDDDSSDNSLAIVKQLCGTSPIPFFIIHHKPSGIGANWNNCIRNAHGAYIKFLFQDDVLHPECIERMIQLALLDKRIGLVFSQRDFINNNNDVAYDAWITKYGTLHAGWVGLDEVSSGNMLLRQCDGLLDEPKNKVGEPPVVLLNSSVFPKVGYFDETLQQVLDCEYWYRVFRYFKVGFVNEKLVSIRLHPEQTTQRNLKCHVDDDWHYTQRLYRNLFFSLSPRVQWKLFTKHNRIYGIYARLIRKIVRWFCVGSNLE